MRRLVKNYRPCETVQKLINQKITAWKDIPREGIARLIDDLSHKLFQYVKEIINVS
jgi:hypothetical protein